VTAKLQFKLNNRCSNNQADQLAILKALEKLEVLNSQNIDLLSTIIFTDSGISLDSLQSYNHGFLVEEIRKKVASLERCGWQIIFSLLKAHIGVHGRKMADKVAKEATRSTTTR
jgi:ribonuclease HI